jgi:hypothetical protein
MLPSNVLGLTLVWIHIPTYHIMLMLVFRLSFHTALSASGLQGHTCSTHAVADR